MYNKDGSRHYITIDEETNLLIPDKDGNDASILETVPLENSKGVIRFEYNEDTKDTNTIFALKVETDEETINELKKLVKGYFFVRQKKNTYYFSSRCYY